MAVDKNMAKIVKRHKYKDKEICETRELTFEPFQLSEIDEVMVLIRNNLTYDLLKGRKKLMYPEDTSTNKYYGHCYHASQALFYLIDTDKLVPMSGEDYRGEKHWWIQDEEIVYDVTAEQYWSVGQNPPYDVGKKSKWYGWKQRPQQITMNLIVKVLGDRLIDDKILILGPTKCSTNEISSSHEN